MKQVLDQHLWSQFETKNVSERVIFLGASNLSRSFPTAVAIARASSPSPLSIHSAMGFGRAYGIDSGYLGKKFSKIFSCGLWGSLQHETVTQTTSFITDIGNDLAYEAPVDVVLEWITTCFDRLRIHPGQVIMTALPIAPLERLSPARFLILRGMFYPRCRLKLEEFLDRAQRLNAGLQELAKSHKTPIFTAPKSWYGFDPIHPRRRFLQQFWRELFALRGSYYSTSSTKVCSFSMSSYLRCLTPPGRPRLAQHASASIKRVQLYDGTKVSLY